MGLVIQSERVSVQFREAVPRQDGRIGTFVEMRGGCEGRDTQETGRHAAHIEDGDQVAEESADIVGCGRPEQASERS